MIITIKASRQYTENHHALVVLSWYHWVAIMYSYQPNPFVTKWYQFHATIFVSWIIDKTH